MEAIKEEDSVRMLYRCISILGVALLLAAISGCSGQSEEGAKAKYRLVKEWKIRENGHGWVVVIDSSMRNENDLRRLGATLQADMRKDRIAAAWIYDDALAASMLGEDANKWEDARADYYFKHFIATYNRNENTGYHRLQIMLYGEHGASINVDY